MVDFSDTEFVFRIMLIVLYSIFSVIRIVYRIISVNNVNTKNERNNTEILLLIMMIYEVLSFVAFVFFHKWIPWEVTHIPLPLWLRWIGLPIGLVSIVYFIIIHQALGKNFSPKLRVKKEQVLITHGPYKRIRHPMYVAFFLLHFAVFFIVANWIIGISWMLFLLIIVAFRVKPEEKMMIGRFGQEYTNYMEKTGRFFPKLNKNQKE